MIVTPGTSETYEVYGCCGKEFAGSPEAAQARLLEHVHTEHPDEPEADATSDVEHLARTRF